MISFAATFFRPSLLDLFLALFTVSGAERLEPGGRFLKLLLLQYNLRQRRREGTTCGPFFTEFENGTRRERADEATVDISKLVVAVIFLLARLRLATLIPSKMRQSRWHLYSSVPH